MTPGAGDQGGGPAGGIVTSVVVPAYNEEARLDAAMQRLGLAVSSGAIEPSTTELLFVDDGSTDDTRRRAIELLAPLPHARVLSRPRNSGKGAAVRAGVAAASGPTIAFMDADMSIDPDQLPALLAALERADLAIGSRAVPGAHAAAVRRRRAVMGRAFNHLLNAVTDIDLRDTQCGFKAFRAPAAKLLFHCSLIERFAFDVEILYLARRLGFGIAEVPVRWSHVGGSRIRPLADSVSVAADILRRRFGRAQPPPVDAIVLAPARDGRRGPSVETVAGLVGPGQLVVAGDGGGVIVLVPLAGPGEVDRLVDHLGARLGELPRRTVRTLPQLLELAPLGRAARREVAERGEGVPARGGVRAGT